MPHALSALVLGLPLLCVTMTSASLAEPQCHSNARYHVVAEPYPEDAGNRFAVTRIDGAAPADCVFDAAKADLVIGESGDPLWFGDLVDDSLVLSRSTGPQGDLLVYDLKTGKPVLDIPADEYAIENGVLSFWERTGQATAATCPTFAENEANGFGSVIAVEKRLDLTSAAVTATGASKCVAVQ
jgi:hypothetical protein